MTSFTSRLYSSLTDLQTVIGLLTASRPAERITDYPGIVDLQEILARPTIQANTSLWQDASGQSVGFRVQMTKPWFAKPLTWNHFSVRH